MLVIFRVINTVILRFEQLADSAEKFGKSPDLVQKKIPERGAEEIRKTALAFNAMQGQIQNLLHERDDMLTAIAHDIRTPLSRIQMDAESISDDHAREHILKNIAEISDIVEKGMSLTKNGLSAEEPKLVDLVSFAEDMAEQLSEASAEVRFVQPAEGSKRICAIVRSSGLEICLRNLIGNGIAYGNGASRYPFPQRRILPASTWWIMARAFRTAAWKKCCGLLSVSIPPATKRQAGWDLACP